MHFQWYPGHMIKARRMMQDNIKLVDLVIELVDARAPLSSRNPDIDSLAGQKPRIIVLNKADLADDFYTEKWIDDLRGGSHRVVKVDARKKDAMKPVHAAIQEVCADKVRRDRKKGMIQRPARAMIVGIPNVGKSTLINTMAGKGCTKTGNRPGITKGKQWIRLGGQVELLDTPGVLWPKFEDQNVGRKLAYIGAIKDEIMDVQELAADLLLLLNTRYRDALGRRYDVSDVTEGYRMLEKIAEERKCVKKGGEYDMLKAAGIVMDEFRSGKLGKITLDDPDIQNEHLKENLRCEYEG